MLTICLPISESLLNGEEKAVCIENYAGAPISDSDLVDMGGDRFWEVFAVETYQLDDEQLAVALVVPEGEAAYDVSEWTHNMLRDGHKLSFCVHLTERGTDINHEWLMHDEPPSQTITTYEQVGDTTLMKPVRDEWKVSSMKVFHPVDSSSPIFDAVYIAQVAKLELVAA
ncbi:hypothetical protein ACQ4M4_05220 [Leptolyngbya sp. AN02str]|uniref:hypothetical protein n=1 Tax=Leptolyngbya sp. AN02str TaxID=3423363 RepID=UPI003D31F43A